ncbi:MAG: hypothetical protein R6W99_09950 [Clostridia bacterium]
MILKFNIEAYITRCPEEAFYFMKNMYLLPWHTSNAVHAYDKATPGEVGAGTEFSERVRLTRKRDMMVITRVMEIREGSILRYEWYGDNMEGELLYRFEKERKGTRLKQYQTMRLHGALIFAAPFIYPVFRIKIKRRISDLAILMDSAAKPEDVSDLKDHIVRRRNAHRMAYKENKKGQGRKRRGRNDLSKI